MTGVLADRYELVEPIGRGGMGSVWRAKARGFGGFERPCVIKRVLRDGGPDEEEKIAMFVREARLCAMLSHRNIVQVFDFGVADGEYYLAMEYVRGRDLLDLCRALAGRLPPIGAVTYVVREVCSALAYAHELADEEGRPLGLVHRDVTPSNVLVGSDGSVKLLDFGVAKAISQGTSITKLGTIKGKLPYMSPEQVCGDPIDGRSDVFSAGILLHELLCMRRLFRVEDDEETLRRLLRLPVPAPSSLRPDVPPALDAICLRALCRAREGRFPGAAAMADALDPLVHELGWNAGRLEAWLRELPPPAPTPPQGAPAMADDERTQPDRVVESTAIRPAHRLPTETTRKRVWAREPSLRFSTVVVLGVLLSVTILLLALR